MARLRTETAPEITVYDESVVFKAASGASAPLVEFKDSSGTVVGNIAANGVMNVVSVVASNAGTGSTALATRGYVDNLFAGINWHDPVALATAAALPSCTYNNGTSGVGATLTATANGALTVDTGVVQNGYSILVKNQADAKQNGIYTVTAAGSAGTPFVLTRRSDSDNSPAGEVQVGDAIFVIGGSTNINSGFILTGTATGENDSIVFGTDSLTYSQFTGTGSFTAGDGLLVTNNVISVGTVSSGRIVVNADSIDLANVTQTNSNAGNVTNFVADIIVDGYGRVTGTHKGDVSFSGYALLANPNFTGVPTAPTANVSVISTQIATTAYVVDQIADDAILKTVANAKGDIFTATADNTPAILTVGTNSQVLVANSSATTGLSWTTLSPTVSLSGDVSGSGTLTNLGNASISVSIGSGAVTSAMIADGTIVNGDINASAAIAHSKLANATAGQVLLGTTTTGVVTATTVSGDVTIDGAGVTAISSGVIVNADISNSAAIAHSKLANATAGQVLLGTTTTGVVTATTVSGDVTINGAGNVQIAAGAIVNADINASAAIDKTKISGTAITAADTGTVTSAMIADGTIVNGDISTSAAIALSKLASGTSAQVIVANSTGVPTYVSLSGDVTVTNAGVTALAPNITISNNLVVSGNLTVSGTTTTINTATLSVADNIVTLNSDFTTGSPTENAGVEVLRGSSATVAVRWNETNDKWESTNDGTTYGNIVTTADSGTVTSTMIADGTIVNADINASAAIAISKLAAGTAGQFILANATGVPTYVTPSGDVSWDSAGNVQIAAGAIVNADINASAAIALSKLAAGTSAQVPVANATGVPTYVAISGDVTLDNTGNVQIAAGVIVNADIGASAAIALSKLASGSSAQMIVANATGVPTYVAISGDVTVTNAGNVQIAAGAIVDADISATAAIDQAKIADTVLNQQVASYTLVLGDKNKMVEISNAGATTLTIPADNTVNMATGATLTVLQTGAGQITIAGAAGVTVNGTPGLKLRTQWSSATLIKRAANTWVAVGDLAA